MRLLRVLSLGATLTTVFAAFMGSYVRGRGAGLACPDWPLCHGQFVPRQMDALVFLEWFHRMVVLGLTLAILSLLVLSWRRGLPQRWLALGVSGVLILQAVLGGLTVLMRLNIWVVALHQAFALVFFGLLVTLTVLLFLARPAPILAREEPVPALGRA